MSPVTDSSRRPNSDAHINSRMLVKISSNNTNNDGQRFSAAYSEETYHSQPPLHTVSSLEPAFYSNNPFRYSSGPSNASTLYNRGNSIIDGPLPSPPNKKEMFAMMPTLEKSITPKASSSILTAHTNRITRDNSPDGSDTWTNN